MRLGPPLSGVAAAKPAVFDGIQTDYYVRDQ
jgi:hypothetical protein